MARAADILLITVNAHETMALRTAFERATGRPAVGETLENRTYLYLGSIGGVNFFHALSRMGSELPKAMRETVTEAIEALNPGAVIAVGIAFGTGQGKQQIGDVLISKQLHCCEPRRAGQEVTSHGDTVAASAQLLNYFQGFAAEDWNQRSVRIGLVLSSEKLIEDRSFPDCWLKAFPEAIGGEMEGAGLYYACRDHNVQWIVIKAIGDWADGNHGENKTWNQRLAAKIAAQFLVHCLQQTPLIIGNQSPRLPSAPARESEQNFQRAYQLLDSEAQLFLHAIAFLESRRVPLKEIVDQCRQALEWDEAKVRHLANGCMDLHLLEGDEELRMHETMAAFVVRTTPTPQQKASLANIRQVQARRLAEVAKQVAASPARADLAAILLLFPPTPERWHEHAAQISTADGETIGRALYELGRFQEAQTWYERTVKQKEQGDAQRRVDQQSLGISLHFVGNCLSGTGKYAEAQPWFERAVKTKEQGDLQGRVNHQSLGASLHQVGYCLSQTGKYAEAQPWCQRAVKAKEQGDAQGRVDHHSLGTSLHQVGYCLSQTGKYAEAQPWYERAAKAKEQGDVQGRVDHESLGTSLHQVGYCLSQTGKYAEAGTWYERAVKEAEQGNVQGRVDHESLGTSLHQMGYCLVEIEKYTEAQPWFERAVKERERGDTQGRVNHQVLGRSLHGVGNCLFQTGKYVEAQPWCKRAVKEAEQGDAHGHVDHPSVGNSLHLLGQCLAETGKYAEARSWFERAAKEKEEAALHGRVNHHSLGRSLHWLGYCLFQAGKYAEVQTWCKRAVQELEQGDAHGKVDHGWLGSCLHLAGCSLSRRGRYAEAQPWFERSLKERERGNMYGHINHEELGNSLHEIGYCLFQNARYAEAQSWLERAVKEREQGDKRGRVNQKNVRLSVESLRDCLLQMGRKDEAAKWERWLEESGQRVIESSGQPKSKS